MTEPTQPALDALDGITVYRLPRSHWHCYLGTYQWEGISPPSLRERLRRVLVVLREPTPLETPPHVFLTGRYGIGKSHLGVAAYRAVADQHGTVLATWLNVPSFCEEVKRGYSPDSAIDPWVQVEDAKRFVVLDDLFGRQLTAHEYTHIIFRLIDTVYQNKAALLVTMNQTMDELLTLLPGHEVSRLLAGHTAFPMMGEDWRIKKV